MATGTEPAAPYSWQYTTQTQEELDESQRQCKSTTYPFHKYADPQPTFVESGN